MSQLQHRYIPPPKTHTHSLLKPILKFNLPAILSRASSDSCFDGHLNGMNNLNHSSAISAFLFLRF